MNNLRFVIDTNILISAILINSSTPDYAYKKAKKLGKILFSELTFEELRQIIMRPIQIITSKFFLKLI